MAKWDKLRKLTRNAEVSRLREQRPELSLEEIGDVFGISGPRVSQICKAMAKRGGR